MDEALKAAAELLAAGNPLAALSHVSRSATPQALALTGCAFAQIGDFERAKRFLTRAARAFGAASPVERARCVTAIAEVALAARELAVPLGSLRGAIAVLAASGDRDNAAHARLVLARSLLVAGKGVEAERELAQLEVRRARPQLTAAAELLRAELALRRMDLDAARRAIARGQKAAQRAAIPALTRELECLHASLYAPAARLIERGELRVLQLTEVQRVLRQAQWLVDVCRRELRSGERRVSFQRKPVLLALLCCLGEASPSTVPRERLIERAFGTRSGSSNESHRARLRVELGRLRTLLRGLGTVQAEGPGYHLVASKQAVVQVLLPPVDGEHAALLALLSDGARWSTSALALALGTSQRTLQRALLALEEKGRVNSRGRGRAQRWFAAPLAGLPPQLLGFLAL